jgi:hypothetical protein
MNRSSTIQLEKLVKASDKKSMKGQVLGVRYQVQHQLGKNAGRRTLLARDLKTQELVVVKLLSFGTDLNGSISSCLSAKQKPSKPYPILPFLATSTTLS